MDSAGSHCRRGLAAVLVVAAVAWTWLQHEDAPLPGATPPRGVEAAPTSAPDRERAEAAPRPPAPRPPRPAREAWPSARHSAGRTTGLDGDTPHAEHARRLDDAPLSLVRARLSEAIERARKQRGLRVDGQVLTTLLDQDSVRILVVGPATQEGLVGRLVGTRHRPLRDYRHIPVAALEVGPQALLEIVESEGVVDVAPDRRKRPSLDDTIPLIHAFEAQQAGLDGTSQVIAILDTGVDTAHPVFEGRVLDEACFSSEADCPNGRKSMFGPGAGVPCDFGCGHGTHVAGVALGLDAGGFSGVAPEAGLISIQVFSNYGGEPQAWDSDIIAGLEHVYVLRNSYEIAAANLSMGRDAHASEAACNASNRSYKVAVDRLRTAGIVTVAASGNDSESELIAAPGCISSVVSVGATSKSDEVRAFSNSAPFLSLLAPGHRVFSPAPGGGFSSRSGTSVAAPHVSGAWASLREAVPDSSVAEVLFALQTSGVPITDERNGVTTTRIDVLAAIETLLAGVDVPDEERPTALALMPAPASEACGLIGLEGLVPLLWLRAVGRRRRGCNDSQLKHD